MMKRTVIGLALVGAFTVSYQAGWGQRDGSRPHHLQMGKKAQACYPSDFEEVDRCGCECCDNCPYWGSDCPGCRD